MVYNWSMLSIFNYVLGFYLKYLQGNMFVNSAINSAAEIVGTAMSGLLLKKFGLKKSYYIALTIAMTGAICIAVFEYSNT